VTLFQREGGSLDLDGILARYGLVHDDSPHGMPAEVAARILPVMRSAQASAQTRIRETLRSAR
jgi:hypothetical protein